MTDIKSMNLTEMAAYFKELGEPAFRAKQVFQWLHRGVFSFDEMTNLSKPLREKLAASCILYAPQVERRQVSSLDGTIKYLWRLGDGNCIETVLMRYHHGNTVCISSQVGCRMGCAFCASTLGGKVRDLTPAEMLDQVLFTQMDSGAPVSNIGLMGIGEPLDNFDTVLRFLELVNSPDGLNIGMRHISLSTWFRSYLYIPLGGNRVKRSRQFFNIFVVWFLTGFWHGAAWNFIFWGLYFFVLLMIEKSFLLKHLEKSRVLSHIYLIFLVMLFSAKYWMLLFINASETEIIHNAVLFILANSGFYIALVFVNAVRFTIQGAGFSGLAILAGVMEMIARAIIGVIMVPYLGFASVCFASPLAWIMADCFLIPAYCHVIRKLKQRRAQGVPNM